MEASYIAGETISYSIPDAGYLSAELKIGANTYALAKSGSAWTATIDTSALSGQYRFAAFADGRVRESGKFYVKTLVSKFRAVVEAIDAALQGVAANGKYSVAVGEISMQDKTFDEMVKARNYYERLADADENGTAPTHGPKRISEVYA